MGSPSLDGGTAAEQRRNFGCVKLEEAALSCSTRDCFLLSDTVIPSLPCDNTKVSSRTESRLLQERCHPHGATKHKEL